MCEPRRVINGDDDDDEMTGKISKGEVEAHGRE